MLVNRKRVLFSFFFLKFRSFDFFVLWVKKNWLFSLFVSVSVAYAFPTIKDLINYISNKFAFLFKRIPATIS